MVEPGASVVSDVAGIGGRPHVVVLTRWVERYADYARLLDHRAMSVSYVTTAIAAPSVPPAAAGIELVEHTDDVAAVRGAVHRLVARYGRPSGFVALKEDDLLVGAELRREWRCPGPLAADTIAFRDKVVMWHALAAAGLPVPRSAAVRRPGDILAFGQIHGWPLVLKPRDGSSSQGVRIIVSPADARGTAIDPAGMLLQEHIAQPIYHVDGVFDGADMSIWRASRYVNSCLDFRRGRHLGSVEEDDPAVLASVGRWAPKFLAALTDKPIPFHLEVFVAPGGDRDCTFLEVGARVGGAEIPFIWREVHGYDLMAAAVRLQLELPPLPSTSSASREVGGWMLVPAPADRPCEITSITSMLGDRQGPYAEAILRVGDQLPDADAYYEHVGGRFRFRGACSQDVEAALIRTAQRFKVTARTSGMALLTGGAS